MSGNHVHKSIKDVLEVTMANKDKDLISSIVSTNLNDIFECEHNIEYPLDSVVIDKLRYIDSKLSESDDDYQIYNYISEIKFLWKEIISKSIKCLRYYDKREPFMANSEKKPTAYGVDELYRYFEKYIEFETMLYGSNRYYRDHVVHVFRTWLLGVECLLKNNARYLKEIKIGDEAEINNFEKVSIWSIIGLTHDLGYPLEKARQIIGKTQEMMSTFVTNPNISMDLSFSGVQNNMNDFVVRFLSSKMKPRVEDGVASYVARLQPKYYFKFQKSLENSKHGVVSSIIIYKILNYFLESDYNINEDYTFDEEDKRQFYIRREILRAIASHTCKDIYHLYMSSFSFLLIIVDDSQEWGRKRISELYTKDTKKYELNTISFNFENENNNICHIDERFELSHDEAALAQLLYSLRKQCEVYMEIFRDGQDTVNRNFTFVKNCEIKFGSNPAIRFIVNFEISNTTISTFFVRKNYTETTNVDNKYDDDFIKKSFRVDQVQVEEIEEGYRRTKKYSIPV